MKRSCSALYIWHLTLLAWYNNFYRKFQTYVLVELGGHAVHYIYDSSLSWFDTRTSIESFNPMSWWNEAVILCTIYMTAHSPGLIQKLLWKVPNLCLSGMRRSCSALYIWHLTLLAWYNNFYRKFETYVLVEWGGHAVHYIYDSSLSWFDTTTSIESSKPMS